MNFLLSDEQLAFAESLDALLRDRCDARHVHQVFDAEGAARIDPALWQDLVAFGVPAIVVPEDRGGLGLGMMDLALVAEALGRHAAPVPFFGHVLATIAIALAGSEAQQARWLPALASGDVLATAALCEGKAGWLDWSLSAAGPLSGVKTMVPNAAEADLIVVGVAEGFALVETGRGVATTRIDGADRTRPLDTVTFDQAPAELLEGGRAAIARVIDAAAVLLAADAFGGAEHCVRMSVDYAKVREQYGTAIAGFQGLRYQLVAMALATEPSRGLYWYAAHAWDALPEEADHAASQAKAHLTDTYLQVTRDTVEAHGGIGFTWEHDTHIYMKRAMWNWAWLGAPARHRLRAADCAGW
jgi:alkylation response protein AidB-like acyl-CoA dehydrogenase